MALLQTIPIWPAFACALPLLYAALRLTTQRAPAAQSLPNPPAIDRREFPVPARRIPCSGEANSLFRTRKFPVPDYQGIHPLASGIATENHAETPVSAPEEKKIPCYLPINREFPSSDAASQMAPAAAETSAAPAYHPSYATQARKLCVLGAEAADIADFFEIGIATYELWRRGHPDFAAAIAQGSRLADDRVADSLYRRAIGFDRQKTKIFTPARAEEPIVATYRERVPADVEAAIFWLRQRRPEEWGELESRYCPRPRKARAPRPAASAPRASSPTAGPIDRAGNRARPDPVRQAPIVLRRDAGPPPRSRPGHRPDDCIGRGGHMARDLETVACAGAIDAVGAVPCRRPARAWSNRAAGAAAGAGPTGGRRKTTADRALPIAP